MNTDIPYVKQPFPALRSRLRREKEETALLFRCIPATAVSFFVVSVICMNLLANKTLVQTDWIALDGGFLLSWLSFLCMDIITKHFGPKASTKIAILASVINLMTSIIFYTASIIPSSKVSGRFIHVSCQAFAPRRPKATAYFSKRSM